MMATDVLKQRFLIKDLSTRTVTLYPSEARIVRDISDVVLKPGPNEIEQPMSTPCNSRISGGWLLLLICSPSSGSIRHSVKVSDISRLDGVKKIVEKYQKERTATFTSHFKATEDLEELYRLITRKEDEEWSAGEDERKGKEKLE